MEVKECYVDVSWRIPMDKRNHRPARKLNEEFYEVFTKDNPYENYESMCVHKDKILRIWYADFNQIWS